MSTSRRSEDTCSHWLYKHLIHTWPTIDKEKQRESKKQKTKKKRERERNVTSFGKSNIVTCNEARSSANVLRVENYVSKN